ncbi:MAG: single-strand selective monofunctional uracil glycosylase [Verrucomicrobiota bacterium]|jgi:single-strand selective monofunctional uracil DNA glycosylase
MSDTTRLLIAAARELSASVSRLRFGPPVAHTYNPLDYAWAPHEAYARRYGNSSKRVVFLGMNPGPHGMMQTGIPFGEVAAVRDWMGLEALVRPPERMHPKLPVNGFNHPRSEVSGRRLWGLFASRFGNASGFFSDHFVVNYCPLGFLSETGANLTPDKLSSRETAPLYSACDEHLRQLVAALRPDWLIGVGDFAEKRARAALAGSPVQFGRVLHPSPASPAANRDWSGAATRQLEDLGVWTKTAEKVKA